MFDITDEDSFQKVKSWVRELKKMLGADISLAIAGNKTDLERERTVPTATAEDYAKLVGASYYETSAKLNDGVDELFLSLANSMIVMENAKSNSLSRRNSTRRGGGLVIQEPTDDTGGEAATGRRCCSSWKHSKQQQKSNQNLYFLYKTYTTTLWL